MKTYLTGAIRFIFSILVLSTYTPGTSLTYAEESTTAEESTKESSSYVMEEVIVTSQKRAEGVSSQDVPTAISAFNAAMIEKSFAVDLTDIGRMVPNAVLNPVGTFPGYPNFSIRGIGINGSARSLDPAVGIFVDGIYLGYPAISLQNAFDREVIEVLRGPQGTLFGRNVTGGAITVRSKRPTGEFDIRSEVTLGNFNQRELAFSVDFPLSGEKVAAKIAIMNASRDGYYEDKNGGSVDTAIYPAGMPDSPTTDKTEVDLLVIRPMITFTPTENLDITLIYEFQRDKGGTASSQNIVNPGSPKMAQTVYGYTPPADKFEINHNTAGGTDAKIANFVADINWDLGHGVLTSISGFRDVEYNTSTDFDGTPFPIFAFPDNEEEQEQVSQELRYASSFSDKFDFVAGIYYFDQEFMIGERREILAVINVAGVTEIEHTNFSIFGESNIYLDEKWVLVVGGRYTQEEKSVKFSPPGTCALDFSSCSVVFLADEDWSNFSPKLAVNYTVNENTMVYGSWTKGFRSGSYNSRAVRAGALGPADEETVVSLEAGLKTEFLDGRARFNLAVFQMDYKDIQQWVNNPDPVFGSEQILFNAADATVTGLEAELIAQLFDGFTLEVSAGFVDAGFDSFENFDANGNGVVEPVDQVIAKGLDFVKVPEKTYSVIASYETGMSDMGALAIRLAYSWTDSYFTDARNDPFLQQDDYGLLDASMTYIHSQEHFKISLFGKNLNDEEYFDYAANVATLDSARWGGTPRTFGLKISYDY